MTWRLPEVYPGHFFNGTSDRTGSHDEDLHDRALRASAGRLAYHGGCLLRTTANNIEILNSASMFREAALLIDLLIGRLRARDEARS